jgi:hypothetical protein
MAIAALATELGRQRLARASLPEAVLQMGKELMTAVPAGIDERIEGSDEPDAFGRDVVALQVVIVPSRPPPSSWSSSWLVGTGGAGHATGSLRLGTATRRTSCRFNWISPYRENLLIALTCGRPDHGG